MIKKHLNIRSKEKNSAYIKPKCKKKMLKRLVTTILTKQYKFFRVKKF